MREEPNKAHEPSIPFAMSKFQVRAGKKKKKEADEGLDLGSVAFMSQMTREGMEEVKKANRCQIDRISIRPLGLFVGMM